MRLRLVGSACTIGLVMALAVLVFAGSLEYEQTLLTQYGEAYDVFAADDGSLYVSDKTASEIRKFPPDGSSYIQFQYENFLDAQPDASGDIWYTNGDVVFGRINIHDTGVDTVTVTTWQVPTGHNLWGIAFDEQQRVWLSEFIGATSKLYRFDPNYTQNNTQLCTVTLPVDGSQPGSSYSYDIKYHQSAIWLVNWYEAHIYRLDPNSLQATWWEIDDKASSAVNLDFDDQDRLWWADQGLDALVSFDPDTSEMISYTLPIEGDPQGIYAGKTRIWYTAKKPGSFGWLDQQTASGSGRTLISDTLPSQISCDLLGLGTDDYGYFGEFSTDWSSASTDPAYALDGWEIFLLNNDSAFYGIAGANQKIWITDQGSINPTVNKRFLRLPDGEGFEIYIPLVRR